MCTIEQMVEELHISSDDMSNDSANYFFERHSPSELLSALNEQCKTATKTVANLDNEFQLVLKLIQHCKPDCLKQFVEDSKSYSLYKDFISLSFDLKTEALSPDGFPDACCNSLMKRATVCLATTLLIESFCLEMESFPRFLKSISPELILLLFQHKDNSHMWTNNTSRHQSDVLLNKVLSCFAISEVRYLLQMNTTQSDTTTPSTTIAGQVFVILRDYLTAEKWKHFPHIKESFGCLLKHIRFPQLSDYLELVLPPSLLVIDDFEISNKVLGVGCLLHIIKNVSSEELRWYGRADVIFEAVKHCLYTHEVPLIDLTHQALLAILKVVDQPQAAQISKYDDVFLIVLQNIEFENKIILRRIYTRMLHSFIDAMGITVIRHTNRLLRIFEMYLETYDGPEEVARFHILEALYSFLKAAWSRISGHTDKLLKILIRFIYDISVDDTLTTVVTKQDLLNQATRCLILLKFCDKGKVVSVLSAIRDISTTNVCQTIIEKTLTAEKPMLDNCISSSMPHHCDPVDLNVNRDHSL